VTITHEVSFDLSIQVRGLGINPGFVAKSLTGRRLTAWCALGVLGGREPPRQGTWRCSRLLTVSPAQGWAHGGQLRGTYLSRVRC